MFNQGLQNELAKRNLTYETAIEIMDRISSQSWDGIMASNYCIPYLHEYPYIVIDLYLEKVQFHLFHKAAGAQYFYNFSQTLPFASETSIISR